MRANLLDARVALARRGLTTSRIAAIALLVVAVGSSVAALVLLALSATAPLPEVHGFRGATAVLGLTDGALGVAIAFRQPRNAVGWIFLVSGACAGSYELAQMYGAYAYLVHPGLPGGAFPGELAIGEVLPPLFTLLFGAVILSIAALIGRFRRSRGVERLQMKWIAYASGLYAVGVFLDSNFAYKPFEIIDLLLVNAIPVAAGSLFSATASTTSTSSSIGRSSTRSRPLRSGRRSSVASSCCRACCGR